MEGFTVGRSQQFLESGRLELGTSSGSAVGAGSKSTEPGKSFSDTLKEAVDSVNQLQKNADVAAANLASGRTDNVAEVMIASEKADIALRLMVQVRNKIIDAYQEVMKMQV